MECLKGIRIGPIPDIKKVKKRLLRLAGENQSWGILERSWGCSEIIDQVFFLFRHYFQDVMISIF
jgi:hypothetical protein